MADPADRLIAAATNAISALFIRASQVLQRTFIRPLAKVRLVQNFTRAMKPLDVGVAIRSQASALFRACPRMRSAVTTESDGDSHNQRLKKDNSVARRVNGYVPGNRY